MAVAARHTDKESFLFSDFKSHTSVNVEDTLCVVDYTVVLHGITLPLLLLHEPLTMQGLYLIAEEHL